MKNVIYIFGIVLFITCNSSKEHNVLGKGNIENTGSISKTNLDLNGTWGLTNYFDSIISNKKLAKYRLQRPTWFAILLKIENDTLKNFGSIQN